MPKHVPTYRHLIASSSSDATSRRTTREEQRTVNELIASSRANRPRDLPPHLPVSGIPSELDAGSSTAQYGPLHGPESRVIHPAELLRRSIEARRRAARGAPGPPPPPSWTTSSYADNNETRRNLTFIADQSLLPRSQGSSTRAQRIRSDPEWFRNNASRSNHDSRNRDEIGDVQVTASELEEAEEMFHHPTTDDNLRPLGPRRSRMGARGLIEYCLGAILASLEDSTLLQVDISDSPQGSEMYSIALGDYLRDQLVFLEPHIKSDLLFQSSLQPSKNHRLSDQSLRAILTSRHPSEHVEYVPSKPHHSSSDHASVPQTQQEDLSEWDIIPFAQPETLLHYLPLTLHRNPISILKQVPSFSALSLSSLNLAYSRIADIERLSALLPSGLRALSLAGIRLNQEVGPFHKAMTSLARKMIVLQMLDLSYIGLPHSTPHLIRSFLDPPANRFPSLRRLGLRGWTRLAMEESSEEDEDHRRRQLVKVIRTEGRPKYVEIIFD